MNLVRGLDRHFRYRCVYIIRVKTHSMIQTVIRPARFNPTWPLTQHTTQRSWFRMEEWQLWPLTFQTSGHVCWFRMIQKGPKAENCGSPALPLTGLWNAYLILIRLRKSFTHRRHRARHVIPSRASDLCGLSAVSGRWRERYNVEREDQKHFWANKRTLRRSHLWNNAMLLCVNVLPFRSLKWARFLSLLFRRVARPTC